MSFHIQIQNSISDPLFMILFFLLLLLVISFHPSGFYSCGNFSCFFYYDLYIIYTGMLKKKNMVIKNLQLR